MPFGFAGGMFDGNTGAVRFGKRDFDPVVGRWISKEPLRFRAGRNFYAYAGNDPVNNIDPTGLDPLGAGGASGQGEGGSEGTGSGGTYVSLPTGASGYVDYNFTIGAIYGSTFGLFVDPYGQVHPYYGVGLMTPTICVSVNNSISGSVSPTVWSWQLALSGGFTDAAYGKGGGEKFAELGYTYPPAPGAALTWYYTW